jgi:hypothetical protein
MNEILRLQFSKTFSDGWFRVRLLQLIAFAMAAVASCPACYAIPQSFSPIDSGWYRSRPSGIDHIPSNRNFLVGDLTDGTTYRDFFVFDLSALQHPVTSAMFSAVVSDDLGVTNPAGTFETWTLFDVTTDIAVLTSGSSPTATYQDLGSGTVLGTMTYSTADRGHGVSFEFNSAALAQLNSTSGLWAFGGAVTTLDNASRSESIFHDSGVDSMAQLTINLPEPSTLLLCILTMSGLPRRVVHRHLRD